MINAGSDDSPAEMALTIAVVTYNSSRDVDDFFAGLNQALNETIEYEVMVADNNSSDDTVRRVQTVAPYAKVVEMGRNAGYAAGINAAIRCSKLRGPVLVLNPDAVLQPGAISELLAGLAYPGAGIVVPRIVDDGDHLKFSLRREPTLLRALGEAVLGGHKSARWPLIGEEVRSADQYRTDRLADWASGAAMMISRSCLDAVGPWDESFFLYSEETDYALRARDNGYLLRYVPTATVRHRGGEMETNPKLWTLVAVNRVRLYSRRHGRGKAIAFWCIAVLNEALRAALGRSTNRAALRALLYMPSVRDHGEWVRRLGPAPS